MSEKRHRLYQHEIPEVIEGLKLRLEKYHENKEDAEKAEVAFRTLYRLTRKESGRPKYPPFSWDLIHYYSVYYEHE